MNSTLQRHSLEQVRFFLPVLLALLFLGAMMWAKARDPFQRIWFEVKAPGHGKAQCIAVLPKMAARPLPVVIYLHGSAGSLLGSGNELRQMAELGLAAVAIEYEQSTVNTPRSTVSSPESRVLSAESAAQGDAFEAQFTALLDYLKRQRWADTHRIAWVGFSLGAQCQLSFLLRHPERKPSLLVQLAGGWVEDLRRSGEMLGQRESPGISVLLVHGENDKVFPLAEAKCVADCLSTNGLTVELNVIRGQDHGFGADRLLVFRVIGESSVCCA